MADHEVTEAAIAAAIEAELDREGPLLPILHGLQEAFGHVPEAALPMIADALNIGRAEVHGVVSFYHDFREQPARGSAESSAQEAGESLARYKGRWN